MKHKPTLTDEEIRSHMNFDKLLQLNKEMVVKAKTKSVWLKTAGYSALAVSLIGLVTYYVMKDDNGATIQDNQSLVDPKMEATLPNVVDSLGSAINPPPKTATKKDEPTTKSDKEKESNKSNTRPVIKSEVSEIQLTDTARKKSLMKFIEAEPIEGYPALYQYFNTELQYPVDMAKDSIEGTVVVSFLIDVKGSPNDIRIVNSLGQAFDKESIRIIENMPKWKAATLNGEPTATRLSIPLTFKILK